VLSARYPCIGTVSNGRGTPDGGRVGTSKRLSLGTRPHAAFWDQSNAGYTTTEAVSEQDLARGHVHSTRPQRLCLSRGAERDRPSRGVFGPTAIHTADFKGISNTP
jgi:hypothetical protein